jgi:hypothetical protein
MTNTCKLIVNPIAGKGTALAKVQLIEGLFRDSSFRYEITVTRGIGHAIEIAEESARKGYGSIVAIGGDRTANEVLNGLMAAKGADRARKSIDYLSSGGILCIAPEGTRSKTGRLQDGYGGVVSLALHGNVPIIPLIHYGGENVWNNLSRLRRTKMYFKAGKPFYLKNPARHLTRNIRNEITREIMFQMAINLPEKYRGNYSNVENATTMHLEFVDLHYLSGTQAHR